MSTDHATNILYLDIGFPSLRAKPSHHPPIPSHPIPKVSLFGGNRKTPPQMKMALLCLTLKKMNISLRLRGTRTYTGAISKARLLWQLNICKGILYVPFLQACGGQ
jgi:hypothetical protein